MEEGVENIESGLPRGLDESRMKPSVARAVSRLRERMPAVRPNGIFKHPPDWTEEEMAFIADCLKQNIPIYTIANMVHCERSCLSRLIAKTPELKELKENQHENILDEAEYQADRLAKSGNASIVMFILQTLGKKRGWTTQEMVEGNGDDESRIVMGEIPKGEVEKAESYIKSVKGETAEGTNPGGAMTDPQTIAAIEETVSKTVAEQIKAATPETIDVSDVKVGPPPYEQGGSAPGSYGGFDGFGGYDGQMMGSAVDDPWASGADSVFSQ